MDAFGRVGTGGTLRRAFVAGALILTVLTAGVSCKRIIALVKKPPPPTFNRPRVDAALAKISEKIQEDPKFIELIKRGPQASNGEKLDLAFKPNSGYQDIGAQLAAKGMARLSPVECLQQVKLKLKMAEKLPKLCAGFWSGGVSIADLGEGLDSLSDSEIERWFELANRATHLELYATTPLPRFSGQVMTDGIRQIAAALPPAESQAFVATMQQGVGAPPAAGCLAFEQLTRGGLALPEAQRDTFLRGLSFDKL